MPGSAVKRACEHKPLTRPVNHRKAVHFLCLTLIFPAVTFPAGAEDFTNALGAYLQQCVHAQIPNGCIVVGLVDERGSRVVSSGTLDNGTDQEANGDTVFGLHSMTGTFTCLLLQDMVERGEMKLDEPAAKYLPLSVKLPTRNGKAITLRHLLYETSGLPDFRATLNPKRAENPLADFSIEKLDAFVSGCELTSDPGTRHFHGAVDKGLLGQAMALRAGRDFESLLVERVCRPLQLESTRFTLTPELKTRLASEHNQLGYATPSSDWGALQPLGGLYSTANDLLKFLSALELQPSSLTPLLQKSLESCFFKHGRDRFDTGGGAFGCRAYAGFDRPRRRGVVVLSTSADLTRSFLDFLMESEWQSVRRPKAAKLRSPAYGAYVGQYRLKSDPGPRPFKLWSFSREPASTNSPAGIAIWALGERPFAQATGPSSSTTDVLLPPVTAELLPQSPTRFFERLSGNPVTFSRDARGKVTGLTMDYQGKAFSFERFSEQPPKALEPLQPHVAIRLDPNLLDACVGQYAFAPKAPFPTAGKASIWREGEQLVGQVWGENALKGAFDIYPESETNFFIKLNGAQLTFIKNQQGQVTAVIHHSAQAGVPDAEGKKLKD